MTARSIMVLGTASHVGKSLTVAALCRIFARAGYRVAPFKAQNMSLNSAATPEGLEIGRAQALQAEACGIPPSVHMNPILLKPGGERSSQIIVRGKVWRTLDAAAYFGRRSIEFLPVIEESYRILAESNDVVVLEGAGSPAEINLKHTDIVNMRMAKLANAPCLLVGDIDRGGVFASLLGTCELLEEDERSYIRGFLINKFRGDLSLLMPGVRGMEDRLALPCFGVVPWMDKLDLDEEDSAGFDEQIGLCWEHAGQGDRLRIAVVALPSLSNFTDFAPLLSEPSVTLRYARDPEHLASAHIVILPGSKQTVQDLLWLRRRGLDAALLNHVAMDGIVVGVCGGFQMLGHEVVDPGRVEEGGSANGLGLLPVRTTMTEEKVTVAACGELCTRALLGREMDQRQTVSGYEIHMGRTEYMPGAMPFASLRRASGAEEDIIDGCVSANGRVFGTYLHGLFDDDSFRHLFLAAAREALHLPPVSGLSPWSAHRMRELDRLADTFSGALDLDAIFGLLQLARAMPLAESKR